MSVSLIPYNLDSSYLVHTLNMEITYSYSYICNLYLISVSVLVYLQGKYFTQAIYRRQVRYRSIYTCFSFIEIIFFVEFEYDRNIVFFRGKEKLRFLQRPNQGWFLLFTLDIHLMPTLLTKVMPKIGDILETSLLLNQSWNMKPIPLVPHHWGSIQEIHSQ